MATQNLALGVAPLDLVQQLTLEQGTIYMIQARSAEVYLMEVADMPDPKKKHFGFLIPPGEYFNIQPADDVPIWAWSSQEDTWIAVGKLPQ